MNTLPDLSCDLFVIGQGLTGMAASVFAANRGLTVCQIGTGQPLIFHSGLFDFIGTWPVHEQAGWEDPWKALNTLKMTDRKHPYSHLDPADIGNAFDEISAFLSSEELPYAIRSGRNSSLATSIGTVKSSYMVPYSMLSAVSAFEQKCPALIVDIKGLREFSATQIRETMKECWPDLAAITVDAEFCSQKGEKTAEHLARALDLEPNRKILADAIRPHLNGQKAVGLPPILGIQRSVEAVNDLEHKLGIPVFEIPGLPPAAPGVRLKETFERGLDKKGVIRLGNVRMGTVTQEKDGGFSIDLSSDFMVKTVKAKGIVLAGGRFMGKGLMADGKKVREPVFGIPVVQPETRSGWFSKRFFDKRGHAISRAGIETDPFQRPLDEYGYALYSRLFAAGSILAHQNWTREKSGSGIALATAYHAVQSFMELDTGISRRYDIPAACIA
jgi:glycerol-3-phosphate dehydrogenase subunit B